LKASSEGFLEVPLIFHGLFGGWRGAPGGVFSFIEEILPGLDFIPTFTIAWLWLRHQKAGSTKF
jgi:hypothetical protein